jgi:uncharacterized membrane protein
MAPQRDTIPSPSSSLPLLITAIGGGLILGARPRDGRASRPFLTLAGMALVGIASHRPLANALRHVGTRRRSADLHFSFIVDRPVAQVFAFCADFENFPRFIGALKEVRDTGDGRSHWCASTPSGGTIEWSATTTKFVTNSVIGWQSLSGSPVEAVGLLRFSPEGGSTCVRVAIRYRVCDGTISDALAALVSPRRTEALEAQIRGIDAHLPLTIPALTAMQFEAQG